jgi:hypothetical protein
MATRGACPISIADGIGPDSNIKSPTFPFPADNVLYSPVYDAYLPICSDNEKNGSCVPADVQYASDASSTQTATGTRLFSRPFISKGVSGGAMPMNPRVGNRVFAYNFGADASVKGYRSILGPHDRATWNFGPGDETLVTEGPTNIPAGTPGFDVPSAYWDLSQTEERIARGKGDLSTIPQFRLIPSVPGDDLFGRPRSDRAEKQDANLAKYKAVQLQLIRQNAAMAAMDEEQCNL